MSKYADPTGTELDLDGEVEVDARASTSSSYADSVAPYPGTLPREAWTYWNLLKWIARDGLEGTAALYDEERDSLNKEAFYRVTGAFNLYACLDALRDADRDKANEVAELIIDAYESGGFYGSWMHTWASECHLDADRIAADAEKRRAS